MCRRSDTISILISSLSSMLWIRDILVRIWGRGSLPLTYVPDPYPDPVFLSMVDKMLTKDEFFSKIFCLVLFDDTNICNQFS